MVRRVERNRRGGYASWFMATETAGGVERERSVRSIPCAAGGGARKAGHAGLSRLSCLWGRGREERDERDWRDGVSINGKSLDLAFLWALGHMLEDETDLLLKGRQIPLHHSPDFPQVNAKIVVDQDVAHFDDLWPGYVLVGFPKGGG